MNIKTLSEYLFVKLYNDIKTDYQVKISKDDLSKVFDMDIDDAKSVAISLLGGSKEIEDFPLILQRFFAVHLLTLQIKSGNLQAAIELIEKDFADLIEETLNDNALYENLKKSVKKGDKKDLKPLLQNLETCSSNLSRKALKKMIPPEEGIKNWCISGYCRDNEENNMILWEDFFWTLIQKNLVWMLDILLENGLNLHSRFARRVLVDSCCLYNKPVMLKALLKRGLNLKDPLYETLVLEVVGWNTADDTEILSILIDHGLDINIPSPKGTNFDMCAINIALCVPHYNMAKLLLKTGVDLNFRDRDGFNSLYHIVSGIWRTPFETDELLELMDIVIEKGADPNVVGKDGRSAVYQCAVFGLEIFLDKILKCGGDINVRSKNGETPLILAAKKGDFSAVRFLQEKGADVNAVDNAGYSAMHHVVKSGLTKKGFKKEHLLTIKLLIICEIDLNLKTEKAKKVKKISIPKGTPALELAELIGADEAVKIIEENMIED